MEVVVRALNVPLPQIDHASYALVEGCPYFVTVLQTVVLVLIQNLECLHGAHAFMTQCEGLDDGVKVLYGEKLDSLVESLFGQMLHTATSASKSA